MRRWVFAAVILASLVVTAGCASLVGGEDAPESKLTKEIVGPNTTGEGVGMEVRVTNTGGVATEGTVFGTAELPNGTVRRTVERVDLQPGESTVVTLRWTNISSLTDVVFKVTVESD